MSDFISKFLQVIVITLMAVVLAGAAAFAGRSALCIDMSQASYEIGDMVDFRCGGSGQVTGVYGSNNGLFELVPHFRYRVRYNTKVGVKSSNFEYWELEEIDD